MGQWEKDKLQMKHFTAFITDFLSQKLCGPGPPTNYSSDKPSFKEEKYQTWGKHCKNKVFREGFPKLTPNNYQEYWARIV